MEQSGKAQKCEFTYICHINLNSIMQLTLVQIEEEGIIYF